MLIGEISALSTSCEPMSLKSAGEMGWRGGKAFPIFSHAAKLTDLEKISWKRDGGTLSLSSRTSVCTFLPLLCCLCYTYLNLLRLRPGGNQFTAQCRVFHSFLWHCNISAGESSATPGFLIRPPPCATSAAAGQQHRSSAAVPKDLTMEYVVLEKRKEDSFPPPPPIFQGRKTKLPLLSRHF